MKSLDAYLKKEPEITFEWHDPETGATGWLIMNSLKGGAAGGGTRMRKGLTRQEVLELAKTMEIKFNVCGPAIGGGKSGIDFDPTDPRKKEVLKRWFTAVKPLLMNYYGTGGDLNVDERQDVSPIFHDLGLYHVQQGVLSGHFALSPEQSKLRLQRLSEGTSLVVRDPRWSPSPHTNEFTTMDLITGYGVYCSIKAYYKHLGLETLKGKRFYIQGWGNVGAAAGWYIAQDGGLLVLIQDKSTYAFNEEGFRFEEINGLLQNRKGNHLPSDFGMNGIVPDEIMEHLAIDCFVPAAASRLVKARQVHTMLKNGLELISCGANVPFDETAIIYGDVSRELDECLAILPDFIANCGVARLFSFLMSNDGPVKEEEVFNDVNEVVGQAVQKILETAKKPRNLIATALENYL